MFLPHLSQNCTYSSFTSCSCLKLLLAKFDMNMIVCDNLRTKPVKNLRNIALSNVRTFVREQALVSSRFAISHYSLDTEDYLLFMTFQPHSENIKSLWVWFTISWIHSRATRFYIWNGKVIIISTVQLD